MGTKTATVLETEDLAPKSCTIEEFFRHKNIFITGGTGFLGTILVEALLSSSESIGKIYLLVRDKNGHNSNRRIQRMLASPIFRSLPDHILKKVVPIPGDLCEPNLGIKKEHLKEMQDSVNVIFHGAATIRFNSHLREALRINLIGTQRTIEFAKSLHNYSAYVYMSTAFCNSNHKGDIFEHVYQSYHNPHDMIKMANDDEAWTVIKDPTWKDIIRDHPNTYTFTKQLAENLILSEMSGMHAGIVRPSIVFGTYEHPVEGWAGKATSGHLGYMAGFMKGIFRTMYGDPGAIFDMIPCDYVINASLVMCWYVGTHNVDKPEVVHSTSGTSNPMTMRKYEYLMNKCVEKHPADLIVWKPSAKLRDGWRHTVFIWLFHIIPAVLIYVPEKLFNLGKGRHTAFDYVRIFNNGITAFEYFLKNHFNYAVNNARRIHSLLGSKDADRYKYDASHCDWSLFLERGFCGMRRYFFKESMYSTKKHKFMWKMYEIVYYIGYLFILAVLYFSFLPIMMPINAFGLAFVLWAFLVWL